MKRIVVLIGSPRKNGNTETLAEAFVAGARDAGNDVDVISVIGKRVGGCIGCNKCYTDPEHNCVQKDDMTGTYARLATADVIAIATPVYFYGVSAQLKCIIDRLHNPIRNTFNVKKLCLLAVCADTIDAVFDSVTTMYDSVLKYFSLEDGGRVLVRGMKSKGDVAGSPALEQARALGRGI